MSDCRTRQIRDPGPRKDATAGSIEGRLAFVDTAPVPPDRPLPTRTSVLRDAVQRWRLVVHRDPLDPDRPQRAVLDDWERALVASGLPMAGLDAPHPKPRYAIAAPLAAAIPGEAELVDIWLTERLPRWRVREALEPVMPPAHRLVGCADAWLGEPALPGRVVASVFRATLPPDGPTAGAVTAAAAALMAASMLVRERRKGEATVTYDLRPFLAALDVDSAAGDGVQVRMTLRHDPSKGVGRPDEAIAALGDRLGEPALVAASLVRERLVLADPPLAEAPKRPPARRPPPDRRPSAGGRPPASRPG
jgi:radical SAM-linked protein